MKIEIQQEDLQQALSVVSSVVPTKTTLPILTSILLEVDGEEIRFSATNLDISVVTLSGKVSVKEEGRLAIPAAKFTTFIRSLAPGPVTITEVDGKIAVNSGKAVLEEPVMNVEEFPALPELADKKALAVDAGGLVDLIRSTAYAVSRDETRPALMGVLWEVRPDSLGLVATDAHRLARCVRPMSWDVQQDRDLIVDTRGLLQLARLAEGQKQVDVHIGQNQLSFKIGDTVLHTRLIEGPFPDYSAVIPRDNDKLLTVDRERFSQAVRRVSITADRMTNLVRVGIEAGRMELSAVGTDGSRTEDEIPITYEGEAVEIGFNFNYLQDILKNIPSANVQMSIKEPGSAALIEPVTDGQEENRLLCLLMPLRLTTE